MNTPRLVTTLIAILGMVLCPALAEAQVSKSMTIIITGDAIDMGNLVFEVVGAKTESERATRGFPGGKLIMRLSDANSGYLYISSRNPNARGRITIDLSIFKNFPVGLKQRPGASLSGSGIDMISAVVERGENDSEGNRVIYIEVSVKYK